MSQTKRLNLELGNRIRAARLARGLRQADVAGRVAYIGVPTWDQTSLSNVERGNRRLTAHELVALCVVLGVRPLDLIGHDVIDEMRSRAAELPPLSSAASAATEQERAS